MSQLECDALVRQGDYQEASICKAEDFLSCEPSMQTRQQSRRLNFKKIMNNQLLRSNEATSTKKIPLRLLFELGRLSCLQPQRSENR